MLGNLFAAGAKLLGGFLNRKANQNANEKNAALQREFAQNSLSWKVADARRAGIHPVYALGASGYNASPSYVGDTYSELGQAGQDISRAVTGSFGQKARVEQQVAALALERAKLENTLLKTQIRNNQQQGVPRVGEAMSGDPYLLPGQPNAPDPGTKNVVKRRHASDPRLKFVEAGSQPEVALIKTARGYAPVPAKHIKESIEDMAIPELMWQIRNQVLPIWFDRYRATPGIKPGKGKEWTYNPFTGTYQQFRKKKTWDYYRR